MENTFLSQKIASAYECKLCDYNTCNKYDFNKHNDTKKHKKRQNHTNSYQNNTNLSQNAILSQDDINKEITTLNKKTQDGHYACDCGKSYKHKSNFYTHRKKCKLQAKENKLVVYNENQNKNENILLNKEEKEEINYKEIIKTLLEQNNSLQNTIKDLIPKIGNNNTTNSNNITNNQNLNISLYLNENYKDALSIDEFVKKIEITVNDLLFTKQKGLVNGISNIFIKHLTDLPEKKRPIWCSDKKRKKIFIKENDWSEDVNNVKTKKAIKDVTHIQAKNTNKYIDSNPDWKQKESKKDEYISIVKHTTDDIINKEGEVINQLVETIYLDENCKKMISAC